MRRKDREVTDFNEVLKIIEACDTCRIALLDGEIPYVVPLSFGYCVCEGRLFFYFHSALEGKKITLLQQGKKVAFEMDCDHRFILAPNGANATMTYACVMGSGKVTFLQGAQKRKGMDLLMAHYTDGDCFSAKEVSLEKTAVFALEVEQFSAKANKKKEPSLPDKK